VPVPSERDEPTTPSDHTSSNRATYDRIALRYAQHQNQPRTPADDLFSSFERAFLARVPDAGVVGDMGCGPAMDGGRFAAQGYRVLGLDLSMGMLAVAAERLPGRLVQGDLRALPLASGQLDAIWSVASLLHVPQRDTSKVLLEFRRTLAITGTLALITALGEGDVFEAVPYAPDEQRWFVYRNRHRLVQQVRDAGFSVDFEGQVEGNRLWSTVLATSA
jgi:SAM-dependent methyltransferase